MKRRKVAKDYSRKKKLESLFGITTEEYSQMLEAQGGVCAICNCPCRTYEYLSVDHCHSTNVIRGLRRNGLCVVPFRHKEIFNGRPRQAVRRDA